MTLPNKAYRRKLHQPHFHYKPRPFVTKDLLEFKSLRSSNSHIAFPCTSAHNSVMTSEEAMKNYLAVATKEVGFEAILTVESGLLYKYSEIAEAEVEKFLAGKEIKLDKSELDKIHDHCLKRSIAIATKTARAAMLTELFLHGYECFGVPDSRKPIATNYNSTLKADMHFRGIKKIILNEIQSARTAISKVEFLVKTISDEINTDEIDLNRWNKAWLIIKNEGVSAALETIKQLKDKFSNVPEAQQTLRELENILDKIKKFKTTSDNPKDTLLKDIIEPAQETILKFRNILSYIESQVEALRATPGPFAMIPDTSLIDGIKIGDKKTQRTIEITAQQLAQEISKYLMQHIPTIEGDLFESLRKLVLDRQKRKEQSQQEEQKQNPKLFINTQWHAIIGSEKFRKIKNDIVCQLYENDEKGNKNLRFNPAAAKKFNEILKLHCASLAPQILDRLRKKHGPSFRQDADLDKVINIIKPHESNFIIDEVAGFLACLATARALDYIPVFLYDFSRSEAGKLIFEFAINFSSGKVICVDSGPAMRGKNISSTQQPGSLDLDTSCALPGGEWFTDHLRLDTNSPKPQLSESEPSSVATTSTSTCVPLRSRVLSFESQLSSTTTPTCESPSSQSECSSAATSSAFPLDSSESECSSIATSPTSQLDSLESKCSSTATSPTFQLDSLESECSSTTTSPTGSERSSGATTPDELDSSDVPQSSSLQVLKSLSLRLSDSPSHTSFGSAELSSSASRCMTPGTGSELCTATTATPTHKLPDLPSFTSSIVASEHSLAIFDPFAAHRKQGPRDTTAKATRIIAPGAIRAPFGLS